MCVVGPMLHYVQCKFGLLPQIYSVPGGYNHTSLFTAPTVHVFSAIGQCSFRSIFSASLSLQIFSEPCRSTLTSLFSASSVPFSSTTLFFAWTVNFYKYVQCLIDLLLHVCPVPRLTEHGKRIVSPSSTP